MKRFMASFLFGLRLNGLTSPVGAQTCAATTSVASRRFAAAKSRLLPVYRFSLPSPRAERSAPSARAGHHGKPQLDRAG
jgi:hypothetical protein